MFVASNNFTHNLLFYFQKFLELIYYYRADQAAYYEEQRNAGTTGGASNNQEEIEPTPSRLLCIGHLEIWRPIELHPHAPLKITSNRRCQENRERVSAGDRQTKSSNKNLKTMFFSISKSDKRKKEREACTRRRSFFVIVPASGDVPRLVCEREGAA